MVTIADDPRQASSGHGTEPRDGRRPHDGKGDRPTPPPKRGRGPSDADRRITALRRFAVSISAFNVLGHLWFGFEQSWAQPLVALAVAYGFELALELLDAAADPDRRPPRFLGGGFRGLVDFLLPAHITGLAVGMLLYANSRLLPIVFAVAVAIASKTLVRARVGGSPRHVFNPSNIGIVAALLAFPSVGIAPPYHFTERISGPLDWVVPGVILVSGLVLNLQLTRKGPLIAGWVGGFVAQAVIRSLLTGATTVAALLPMTGVAFILFTNYMITDPGTTPTRPRHQVLFGLATAATYGLLVAGHVVFGLFFALAISAAARGVVIGAANAVAAARAARRPGTVGTSVPPATPVPAAAPAAAKEAASPTGPAPGPATDSASGTGTVRSVRS